MKPHRFTAASTDVSSSRGRDLSVEQRVGVVSRSLVSLVSLTSLTSSSVSSCTTPRRPPSWGDVRRAAPEAPDQALPLSQRESVTVCVGRAESQRDLCAARAGRLAVCACVCVRQISLPGRLAVVRKTKTTEGGETVQYGPFEVPPCSGGGLRASGVRGLAVSAGFWPSSCARACALRGRLRWGLARVT